MNKLIHLIYLNFYIGVKSTTAFHRLLNQARNIRGIWEQKFCHKSVNSL